MFKPRRSSSPNPGTGDEAARDPLVQPRAGHAAASWDAEPDADDFPSGPGGYFQPRRRPLRRHRSEDADGYTTLDGGPSPSPADRSEPDAAPSGVDRPLDGGQLSGSSAAAAADDPLAATMGRLADRVDELVRLRQHDAELVDRLHAENSRLRAGELTEAMAPVLRGLIRLHDQMSSLGAEDAQSVAGILRKQLLQLLDVAADVRPYTPVPGTPFDPVRHLGVRKVATDDPVLDRTIVRTIRPGFVRGESAVVRPAETEVYRAH